MHRSLRNLLLALTVFVPFGLCDDGRQGEIGSAGLAVVVDHSSQHAAQNIGSVTLETSCGLAGALFLGMAMLRRLGATARQG